MKSIKSVSKKKLISIALVIVLCLTGMNIPAGNELKGNTKVSVFDEIVKPNVSENKLTDISEIALSDGEKAAEIINSYKYDVDYEAALNYALTAYYTNENFEEMDDFIANIDGRSKDIVEGYKLAAEERSQGTSNGYVPGEAIVMFDENTTEEEINAVVEAEYGKCDEIVKLFNGQTMAVVSISLGQTVDMATDSYSEYCVTKTADSNDIAEVAEVAADSVNDPYAKEQYQLDTVNVKEAWDYVSQVEHEKILVGVIDTGVQIDHPDLENVLSPYSADVTSDEIVLLSECENTYTAAHGTNITGILAAEANNNKVIAGIASCYNNDVVEILAVQASEYYESTGKVGFALDDQVKAINYCVEQGVKVISMSYGGNNYNSTMANLLKKVREAGVILVAGGGNDSNSENFYPSDYPDVIGVVALDRGNVFASYTNYGMQKDICAPGHNLCTVGLNSSVGYSSGTSSATPVVSGIVSMMCSVNKNLNYYDVKRIISDTSIDFGQGDWCRNGLINAGEAVKFADKYAEVESELKNLALNKTVTLSEGASADAVNYPAENLTDGDQNTRWIASSEPSKTIVIDLEKESVLDNIEINYNGLYSCTFETYISTDGETWKDISDDISVQTTGRIVFVGMARARYIKLVYNVTQTVGIKEIKVFGYDRVSDASYDSNIELLEPIFSYNISDGNLLSISVDNAGERANYAYNVYVNDKLIAKNIYQGYGTRVEKGWIKLKITSVYSGKESDGTVIEIFVGDERVELSDRKPAYSSSDEWEGCAAKYAVDNSAGTRWASLATDNEWIYVDLEKVYSVSKVILEWEAAYGKTYDVQVSNDAVNWKTVKNIVDSDGGEDIIEFESIDARYVKINGVKRATGYGYSLWNFEVYGGEATGNTGDDNSGDDGSGGDGSGDDNSGGNTENNNTPINVNLAANMPGTSSSNEGDNVAANNAFDGNTGTRWSSQFSDDNWIYVDLGQTYSVDKVVLNWEGAYGKDYNIDVSTDGVEWTTVSELRNQDGSEDVVTFNLTDARYVRMNGVARGTGYGYSLWEMEVYCTVENSGNNGSGNEGGNKDGNEGGGQDNNKTSELISQGKTATSSSDEWEGYVAGYAFDGNTGSRWASSWTDNEWIYVDLGQTYTVDKVVLNWEGAYGKDYNIDVSTDGVEWTTISELRNQNGGEDEITFNATSARYVKMTGIARGTGYGYSLFEMNVYGY